MARRPDLMWIVCGFLVLLFAVDFVADWRTTSAQQRLRDAVIRDCEDEQEVDRVTAEDLQARIELYAELIDMERTNKFVDEAFRSRRVAAYTQAQTQAMVRLQGIPAPVNCEQVYASDAG